MSGGDDVQLGRLRLALRGHREVLEVELGALRVGADQVGRLVRVEERERLRARPVRVHAHGGVGRTAAPTTLLPTHAERCRPKGARRTSGRCEISNKRRRMCSVLHKANRVAAGAG